LIAEIIPWLRGRISVDQRSWDRPGRPEHAALHRQRGRPGSRTWNVLSDHFLRTKISPFVDWDPETRTSRRSRICSRQASRSTAATTRLHERTNEGVALDADPSRPSSSSRAGMIAGGRRRASPDDGEFYNCAIEVMRGRRRSTGTRPWTRRRLRHRVLSLEEPSSGAAARERARAQCRVVGAGAGIGRHAIGCGGSAHVACVDASRGGRGTAQEIAPHGRASECRTGSATAVRRSAQLRHHRPGGVVRMLASSLAYGGWTRLSSPGVSCPDTDGRIEDRQWGSPSRQRHRAYSSPTKPTASSSSRPAGDRRPHHSANAVWPRRGARLRHQQGGRQPLVRELAVRWRPSSRERVARRPSSRAAPFPPTG